MVIPLVSTGLVVLIGLGGTLAVAPDISPWPRFWAGAFFALLLWPVGLTLVGRFGGRRAQLYAAVVVLAASAAQQLGAGSLPLPLVVRWSVSLSGPGDAIRREIALPARGDAAWERAWARASRVAVAVCSEEAIDPAAGVRVMVAGGPSAPLDTLARTGRPGSAGWYNLPVSRAEVERGRTLSVEVRREAAGALPARICGGQDDPTRPGWEGSARLAGGRWITDQLADVPIPPIAGRPAPSRYYIELRFYDSRDLPHVGIWY